MDHTCYIGVNLLSQILWLQGYYPSWSEAMCSFYLYFWVIVWITHVILKVLFTLWNVDKYLFKFPLCVNLLSQILQLEGFSPSWTEAICPFSLPFWVNFRSLHKLLICVFQVHFLTGWFLSFMNFHYIHSISLFG